VSKSKVTILALAVTLLASNAWWLYHMLDTGITLTYQDVSLHDTREALDQALAILPLVARPDASRAQVLSAAASAAQYPDSFEKDGYIWVGRLGLKFNEGGQFVKAVASSQ